VRQGYELIFSDWCYCIALFWELNCKVKEEYFYHRHSYVCLFYRVKAEKKPNLLKVKIQDAYFFYKKSFKRTGPLQQLSNAEYAKPYLLSSYHWRTYEACYRNVSMSHK
jgi:hypothetical protein